METDIFKHIKIIIYKVFVKMTKQHIFIIENNLQKVGVIFSLIPSDNHDTRSTCPTSVFTGTRQSDKR
jgi:hypothetical protein